MAYSEVRIIRIDPVPGAQIEKAQRGYRFPIRYVLEDGRIIAGSSSHSLQRDAKAELATLPKAPRNVMKAAFDGNQMCVGICETFELFRGAR